MILSALAATSAPAQNAPSSVSIFGVPLGATDAEIEQMAARRGFGGPAPSGRCPPDRVCSHRVNIENLPGTEFVTTMWGHRTLPDRSEAFSFAFTAPPNEHRVWSAGSDQRFGDQHRPSPAAPLLNDVLVELRQRYGEPARTFAAGGGEISRNLPIGKLIWVWDAEGRPVRWTRDVYSTCYFAIGKAAVEPGIGALANSNAAPVNPEPFLLARRGNCARAVEVNVGHARGLVHYLSVRAVDFQAGHDALFHTTRLVRERSAETDRQRSNQNRPDF